jgi:hypothetical protein
MKILSDLTLIEEYYVFYSNVARYGRCADWLYGSDLYFDRGSGSRQQWETECDHCDWRDPSRRYYAQCCRPLHRDLRPASCLPQSGEAESDDRSCEGCTA